MYFKNLQEKLFEEDLTIAFSGYNIREYLELSINSLLHFYPHYKDKIIVFDDNSTDDTKEWLRYNNIKRISWKNEYDLSNTSETGYRIGCIFNEIFNQCETRYLMLNDGDVVFFDYFKYNYSELIYKYPILITTTNIPEQSYDLQFKKYDILYYNNEYNRVFPYHMLLDMKYIRNNIENFDRLTEEWKFLCNKLDLGADFYYQILSKGLKFKELYFTNYIYHFIWSSSIKRLKEDKYVDQQTLIDRFEMFNENYNEEYKKNKKLREMIHLYGRNIHHTIKD